MPPVLLAAASLLAAHPLEAQRTPTFALGAGAALPAGTTSDRAEVGPMAGAWGVFPLPGGRLGLTVDVSYTRLHASVAPALQALDIEPGSFRGAGGVYEGGYHWAAVATVGLQLPVRPRAERVVPWLQAAGGFARTGVAEARTWLLGEVEDHPASLQTAWVTAAGAGVNVRVSAGINVYARGRWLVLFTDPEPTTFLPFELGLSLQLEPRGEDAPSSP